MSAPHGVELTHPAPLQTEAISRANERPPPYRSLSGDLRDRGGYSKVDVPFLEFLWANHLRQHVPLRLLTGDPGKALSKALQIAHSKQRNFLPGWCGKL